MAYDVIKTIRGREYRYRVQSERDPQTGKTRNRWTYVGRVASERTPALARTKRSGTRSRLLSALQAILERGDPSAVTPDAIAREAGVAHGTFYRYFSDRSDALRAFAEHIRATRGFPEDALRSDVMNRAQARADLRAWVTHRLTDAAERGAIIRVWYALMASDERLSAFKEERRRDVRRALAAFISALNARGFADVDDPDVTAAVLYALIDGIMRSTVLEGEPIDPTTIAATVSVVERAVFAQALASCEGLADSGCTGMTPS